LRAHFAENLDLKVRLGGPDCTQPYDIAMLNVSAMSFCAPSANAIEALNAGAARGGFAHDTGEGGISRYHLRGGGDLIWEIGSGYFGCRGADGRFDAAGESPLANPRVWRRFNGLDQFAPLASAGWCAVRPGAACA
jgi:glutamate synthase domain-containing protein 2